MAFATDDSLANHFGLDQEHGEIQQHRGTLLDR